MDSNIEMSGSNEIENKQASKVDDNEEKRIFLVRKCLFEIVYLYKLSALIEIVIFLTIITIFFIFYFFETNVEEFFKKNEKLKADIFHYKDINALAQNLTKLDNHNRVFDIIRAFDFSLLREIVCNSCRINFM